ncbi:N-acetylmuramoyl-L-alanine amidase [Paenibacillus sp. UMB4589-SE434]|nr:N-acetylmuramoyl-L-alanine amidase [Paenibacillus sp. UMB4589-SE434]MDK8181974.1 N-acetylmuramoyl-L-alanine amidase [Paenibacillus sp. UMB4589-SE434]
MPMNIKSMLLPAGAPNKPNRGMQPRYITVHNTDNTARGATAEAHARFQLNGSGGISKSWHYTVDDQAIYQHLQDLEQGWHAGDGAGPGNALSIGIEICMYDGMNEMLAWRSAAELIASLMVKHDIPLQNVVPHKHWSGKACPSRLLPHWQTFVQLIQRQSEQTNNSGQPKLKDAGAEAVKVKVVCSDNKTPVMLNGLLVDGQVYVPARALAHEVKAKVEWDNSSKQAALIFAK